MKKIITTLVLLGGFLFSAMAQAPVVAEKEVSFKKQKVNAYTATYSGISEADLSGALEGWLQKNIGGKKTKTSGYQGYTGSSWNSLDAGAPLSIYYKVDGSKKNSTLTLLIANKDNQFLSSSNNAAAGGKLYSFFNEMADEVAAYQKQQVINQYNATLSRQEADYQKLTRKAEELKKAKEKLDREIADNDKAMLELSNGINATKDALKEAAR